MQKTCQVKNFVCIHDKPTKNLFYFDAAKELECTERNASGFFVKFRQTINARPSRIK